MDDAPRLTAEVNVLPKKSLVTCLDLKGGLSQLAGHVMESKSPVGDNNERRYANANVLCITCYKWQSVSIVS